MRLNIECGSSDAMNRVSTVVVVDCVEYWHNKSSRVGALLLVCAVVCGSGYDTLRSVNLRSVLVVSPCSEFL